MTTTMHLPPARRRRWLVPTLSLLLPAGVLVALALTAFTPQTTAHPDLSQNILGVTCPSAHDIANEFTRAVNDAELAQPDYSGVRSFGFTPPVNPSSVNSFKKTLEIRRQQVDEKARSVTKGTCTDNPTAQVTDANGKHLTLPLVAEDRPDDPLSGSESNRDPRTVPVTIGSRNDHARTNSWTELDQALGDQQWYRDCTEQNLGIKWDSDLDRFEAAETDGHDSRFILAVNTTLNDDQARQRVAADGNPNVDKLPIVRTDSIINTRHLGEHRCDIFVDTRSMVRVSLGKVKFNSQGEFAGIETNSGSFVDCHNLWRIPKAPPRPTPSGSTPPSTTPPVTTPPTSPSSTCKPPLVGTPPSCLQSKDPNQGPVYQGNVPTQVQGQNPPAGSTAEPRLSDPPETYVSSAPPRTTQATRSVPPPEDPAPRPSDPATGCVPPPGMTTC